MKRLIDYPDQTDKVILTRQEYDALMGREQIAQIYQAAIDGDLELFKSLLETASPEFIKMAFVFYTSCTTNKIYYDLARQEVQFTQDLRAKNKAKNLEWLEKHKQETGYYTIN